MNGPTGGTGFYFDNEVILGQQHVTRLFVPATANNYPGNALTTGEATAPSITFTNGTTTISNWAVTGNIVLGAGTVINISNSTFNNTVIFNGIATTNYTANYVGNYISYPSEIDVPKNHCGVGIRSYNRDRQFDNVTAAEMLALQLLRKMVGQDEFRRYLKHGFILARGASGLSYQIDRRNRIVVWDCGEKLASLCVHLKHDLKTPPTDEVVAKLLIVECDEADIWKRSNVSWFTAQRHEIAGDKALANNGIIIGAAEGVTVNMAHGLAA